MEFSEITGPTGGTIVRPEPFSYAQKIWRRHRWQEKEERVSDSKRRSAEEIQRVQKQASNIILAKSSKMAARVLLAAMETGQNRVAQIPVAFRAAVPGQEPKPGKKAPTL